MKQLIEELGFDMEIPIAFIDNMSTIKLTKNSVFHQRTNHINIKHHALREMVENNIMTVEHVRTNDMLADPLTKALSASKLNDHFKYWGMCILRADVNNGNIL